jgi:predicted alpha/beta superfamily hydrolase
MSMTGVTTFAAAALALALCIAAGPALAAAPPALVGEPSPIVIGQSYRIQSKVLGAPRTLNVYVPPSYAKGQTRYNVLYLIDGGQAQDFHHISGLAQLATIAGATQEMIVVGVETEDRTHELTARSPDPRYLAKWATQGGSGDFRRYVADEVVPFVEARWRTNGETALMGESFAGLFVVETFLKQPTLFDRYIAVDPSLWWDNRALAKDATRLLKAQDDTPRTLWLAFADASGSQQDGMDRLLAALKSSAPKGLKWSSSPRPDETHATIYHGAALDALRAIWGLDTHWPIGPNQWWLQSTPTSR